MIRGLVDDRLTAGIDLRTRGPGGVELALHAVIDTGFDDSLILPAASVAILGLTKSSVGQAFLADGSVKLFDVFDAEVEWYGSWRPIKVSAVDEETLVGMAMLERHELRIEVVPGGAVAITRLP